MEKKNLILAGLGLTALTGIGGWLLKKNKKTKEEVVTGDKNDNNASVLSYDQVIERLSRYSATAGREKAVFASAYLDTYPQPIDFFKEYYLFSINTFGTISISIVSGTHKNGIITQDEVLYFRRNINDLNYPRFKVTELDYTERLKMSSEELQKMEDGNYYFGNCIWEGENDYGYGWYRSLENIEINRGIHTKKGGPVEVRALVSKTVFDKLKALQDDLYDMPASYFLDQLDKIFEEEIARPRTKQEIEG